MELATLLFPLCYCYSEIRIMENTVEAWTAETLKEPPSDVAIVFGQGPVQDASTKVKIEEIAKKEGVSFEEEANTWAKTLAVATGYLREKGQIREAIFSGGRTGGDAFSSEGELMKKDVQKVFGEPPEGTYHVEGSSPKSMANLGLSLNMIDDLKTGFEGKSYDKLAVVCSKFHAPRVKILSVLYAVNPEIFTAESVLEVMAHDMTVSDDILGKAADTLIPNRDKKIPPRQAILDWLEKRLDFLNIDINRTEEGDYRSFVGGGKNIEEKKGPFHYYEQAEAVSPTAGPRTLQNENQWNREGTPVTYKAQSEDRFVYYLVTEPANWMGFLNGIKSDQRLLQIIDNLRQLRPDFLDKVGIKGEDTVASIRAALSSIKRPAIEMNWTAYNPETAQSVETLLQSYQTQRAERLKKHD